MNRKDFIIKLTERYAAFFKDRNKADIVTEYNIVLNDNWDFEKLYGLYIADWDKTTTPPAPAYFNKFATEVRKPIIQADMPADRKQALIKVAQWFNSADFQFYRKPVPATILLLIREFNLTEAEIGKMMISGEANAAV